MAQHDYLNDPRLKYVRGEPLELREVYASRLKVQDATHDMTEEQLEAYYKDVRKEADARCERLGIRLKYADSPSLPMQRRSILGYCRGV
jgi:hypothetical protein